jgi:cystathionine beta-lyase
LKYDFDRVYDRKNMDCVKWDLMEEIFGNKEVIPMWVADMDFPTAQPIVEALKHRAEHPFYGYTRPGKNVVEAVVERMQKKYSWKIEPEWVVFTPGVIPALNVAVRALTHPGDQIILQQPVYHPFFPTVTGSGCHIVNNALKLNENCYEMDFDDLEDKFAVRGNMLGGGNRIKAIILCNPHNPVGRLWKREELEKLGEIVIRKGAIVISDEIHCEILYKGFQHTPFAAISKEFEENCIVCMAPSKTFSLAGLEISNIIIPNPKLREAFNNTRAGILPGPNLFAYTALESAYRQGDEWLEQVLDYLQGNLDFILTCFAAKIPKIKVIRPQGTYLVWLDCRALGINDQDLRNFLIEKAKIWLDEGTKFGAGGNGFMRMNIACPRPILLEALKRLETAIAGL